MAAAQMTSMLSLAPAVRVNASASRSSVFNAPSALGIRSAPLLSRSHGLGSRLVARAETKDVDFDSILSQLADKFEKADNKGAIIGYSAAAFGALVLTEWLIHLPGLSLLLGFPIQLIGVLSLPLLYTRYVAESNNIVDDIGDATKVVTKQLPGLDK